MKQEEITISDLITRIESGEKENIRLKTWQLAHLFGIYESTVRTNIKAIIKSNIVQPDYNSTLVQERGILLPEAFGLDMVIALSFRINSAEADKLRRWIIGKLTKVSRTINNEIILFSYSRNNQSMLN